MTDVSRLPNSDGSIAVLLIEVSLFAGGDYEVSVPDAEGGEYARTYGLTAAKALAQAGQYVELVLEAASPDDSDTA